jgi:thymidylate synthase (FAD)
MILVRPSATAELTSGHGRDLLISIEAAGRTCYKSEPTSQGFDGTLRFVKNLIERGHESVLEHEKLTARVVCDRGVSHEIVRHRIASYSQESTRYCDYNKGHVTFVIPPWVGLAPQVVDEAYITRMRSVLVAADWNWLQACWCAEVAYKHLRALGWKPEQARSVLPNSLKTEIVMTMNLREWRHFFTLRLAKAAHPQMRETAGQLLRLFKPRVPVVFDEFSE